MSEELFIDAAVGNRPIVLLSKTMIRLSQDFVGDFFEVLIF
ncbi:hypothetical protein B4110_0501 [Parageobacillus toebii]|uniref:Uncharacterized protein n=1 Tax=Parageobacillus toebii TaxID=153151 RepID=A0A150N5Q9_9BACL|nr:hypothetical protein B4110_0501 [Parageobacillus toebii]